MYGEVDQVIQDQIVEEFMKAMETGLDFSFLTALMNTETDTNIQMSKAYTRAELKAKDYTVRV